MKQTEQYLRAATRGMWGRARRELRTELQGHISERVAEFRLSGLSAEDAERQTLRELGTPVRVSGGMLGVHTVPALGKAGALSLLLATTLLTVLPQGLAQVKSIVDDRFGSYLDFGQLQNEFQKSGGSVEISGTKIAIQLPNQTNIIYNPTLVESVSASADMFPQLLLSQKGKTYVNLAGFISSFTNNSKSTAVNVSGWKNPILRVGKVDLPLVGEPSALATELYGMSTYDAGIKFTAGRPITYFTQNQAAGLQRNTRRILGDFKKGKIYALIIPLRGRIVMEVGAFISPTHSAGQLSFDLPDIGGIRVVSNELEFQQAVTALEEADAARTSKLEPVADPLKPYPALLLELSGHFGPDAYTVVPSKAVQLAGQ